MLSSVFRCLFWPCRSKLSSSANTVADTLRYVEAAVAKLSYWHGWTSFRVIHFHLTFCWLSCGDLPRVLVLFSLQKRNVPISLPGQYNWSPDTCFSPVSLSRINWFQFWRPDQCCGILTCSLLSLKSAWVCCFPQSGLHPSCNRTECSYLAV